MCGPSRGGMGARLGEARPHASARAPRCLQRACQRKTRSVRLFGSVRRCPRSEPGVRSRARGDVEARRVRGALRESARRPDGQPSRGAPSCGLRAETASCGSCRSADGRRLGGHRRPADERGRGDRPRQQLAAGSQPSVAPRRPGRGVASSVGAVRRRRSDEPGGRRPGGQQHDAQLRDHRQHRRDGAERRAQSGQSQPGRADQLLRSVELGHAERAAVVLDRRRFDLDEAVHDPAAAGPAALLPVRPDGGLRAQRHAVRDVPDQQHDGQPVQRRQRRHDEPCAGRLVAVERQPGPAHEQRAPRATSTSPGCSSTATARTPPRTTSGSAYDDFSTNPVDMRVAVSANAAPPNFTVDNIPGASPRTPPVTNPGLRLAKDPRNGAMYAMWQETTGGHVAASHHAAHQPLDRRRGDLDAQRHRRRADDHRPERRQRRVQVRRPSTPCSAASITSRSTRPTATSTSSTATTTPTTATATRSSSAG